MNQTPTRNDLQQQLDAVDHERLLRKCRRDCATFIAYVFKIEQQPFHRELHAQLDAHQYCTIDAPVEHGKTFQVSIGRTLWQLGRNVQETIAIISNTSELPEMCLAIIRDAIVDNVRVHQVFPALKVARFGRSKVGNLALTVERGPVHDKDPSVVAMGMNGSIIGRRWSILKTDDIQDMANTWTEHERRKTTTIFTSTMVNRLLAEGRHEDIGTPWHLLDTRHTMRKMDGYVYRRFDAATGGMYDIHRKLLRYVDRPTLWPKWVRDAVSGKLYGFPTDRLEHKARMLPSYEYDRQFRCIALAGSLAVFKQEHMEAGKALGRGLRAGRLFDGVVVSGVDLAVGKKDTHDKTSIVTLGLRDGQKHLLEVRSGRWEVREIVQQLLYVVERWPDHRGFRVETNGGQDYLRQVLDDTGMVRVAASGGQYVTDVDQLLQRLDTIPHNTTGQHKHDPIMGVRGMSVEFENGKVVLPCDEHLVCEESVQTLIDGLISFDPLTHTADEVMALWLAMEESRRYGSGTSMWDRFGVA